jgi:diguanylate cyclase (GGDEF)-like protein
MPSNDDRPRPGPDRDHPDAAGPLPAIAAVPTRNGTATAAPDPAPGATGTIPAEAGAPDRRPATPAQERTDCLAYHDLLTGLPNRILLQDRLGQAIRRAQRARGRLALLFVGLDDLKEVNDTLGHAVGDRVLAIVAQRLGERLRGADTLARLGGDAFLILLDGNTTDTGAAAAARACLEVLTPPIQVQAHEVVISASIGISLFPDDGTDAQTLLRTADLAMDQAKQQGRGNYQFHAARMSVAAQEHHALERALRGALARGELTVYYQPQLELATGRLWGVEALARWTHPEFGSVPPGRFIPIAERIGVITEIGERVLSVACRQLAGWRAAGFAVPHLAVNVSVQQLARGTLLPTVQRNLVDHGLAPGDLDLEVNEAVIMGECARVITALSDLRALGTGLVIDDFGTGSCTLGRIHRIPLDRLKIHDSFIRRIGRGANDEAITRAIIGLGRDFGLGVMAEGVERENQSSFLLAAGCRVAQGHLFGTPMDAESLGAYLGRGGAA